MVVQTMRSHDRRQQSAEQVALGVRVAAEAVLAYGDRADEAELRRYAEQAVDEICNGSVKVTAFVPILALRRVGELLDQSDRNQRANALN